MQNSEIVALHNSTQKHFECTKKNMSKKGFVVYFPSFGRIACSHTFALCNHLYLISALICCACFITVCSAGQPELFFLLWSMENENDFWRQTDISIIQYSPKVSLHRRGANWLRTLLTHFRHPPLLLLVSPTPRYPSQFCVFNPS